MWKRWKKKPENSTHSFDRCKEIEKNVEAFAVPGESWRAIKNWTRTSWKLWRKSYFCVYLLTFCSRAETKKNHNPRDLQRMLFRFGIFDALHVPADFAWTSLGKLLIKMCVNFFFSSHPSRSCMIITINFSVFIHRKFNWWSFSHLKFMFSLISTVKTKTMIRV